MVVKLLRYLPTLGIIGFLLFSYIATTLYPGGSDKYPDKIGFDWSHNYLCNLLPKESLNGAINSARPLAIVSLFILAIGLIAFFILFAKTMTHHPGWEKVIKYFGTSSIPVALLIATPLHDQAIIWASLFGLAAGIGIVRSIFRGQHQGLKLFGLFSLVLIIVNNIIYYSEWNIHILARLQKFSFLVIFIWIIVINIDMVKRLQNET